MTLTFDEWYDHSQEELWIQWAETGRDREYCFNADNEFEKLYDKYVADQESQLTLEGGRNELR